MIGILIFKDFRSPAAIITPCMAILFNIDHVSFSYRGSGGNAITALNDISFQVQEGEFIAIIGANGSGKTTLARLMGSLLMPSTGKDHRRRDRYPG